MDHNYGWTVEQMNDSQAGFAGVTDEAFYLSFFWSKHPSIRAATHKLLKWRPFILCTGQLPRETPLTGVQCLFTD